MGRRFVRSLVFASAMHVAALSQTESHFHESFSHSTAKLRESQDVFNQAVSQIRSSNLSVGDFILASESPDQTTLQETKSFYATLLTSYRGLIRSGKTHSEAFGEIKSNYFDCAGLSSGSFVSLLANESGSANQFSLLEKVLIHDSNPANNPYSSWAVDQVLEFGYSNNLVKRTSPGSGLGFLLGAAAIGLEIGLDRRRKRREAANTPILEKAQEELNNAPTARSNGKLELGKFILNANLCKSQESDAANLVSIDDYVLAQKIYSQKLAKFKQLLKKDVPIEIALAQVVSDIAYDSENRMLVECLTKGSGNCESTSHLAAALVYDAGFKDQIYFRSYSMHLAPIFVCKGKPDYDFTMADVAQDGGLQFSADSIIEALDGKAIRFDDKIGGTKIFQLGGATPKKSHFTYPISDDSYHGGRADKAPRAFNAPKKNTKKSTSGVVVFGLLVAAQVAVLFSTLIHPAPALQVISTSSVISTSQNHPVQTNPLEVSIPSSSLESEPSLAIYHEIAADLVSIQRNLSVVVAPPSPLQNSRVSEVAIDVSTFQPVRNIKRIDRDPEFVRMSQSISRILSDLESLTPTDQTSHEIVYLAALEQAGAVYERTGLYELASATRLRSNSLKEELLAKLTTLSGSQRADLAKKFVDVPECTIALFHLGPFGFNLVTDVIRMRLNDATSLESDDDYEYASISSYLDIISYAPTDQRPALWRVFSQVLPPSLQFDLVNSRLFFFTIPSIGNPDPSSSLGGVFELSRSIRLAYSQKSSFLDAVSAIDQVSSSNNLPSDFVEIAIHRLVSIQTGPQSSFLGPGLSDEGMQFVADCEDWYSRNHLPLNPYLRRRFAAFKSHGFNREALNRASAQ